MSFTGGVILGMVYYSVHFFIKFYFPVKRIFSVKSILDSEYIWLFFELTNFIFFILQMSFNNLSFEEDSQTNNFENENL